MTHKDHKTSSSCYDSYNPNGSYEKYEYCQKQQDHRKESLAIQSGYKIFISQRPDRQQDGSRTCELNKESQISARIKFVCNEGKSYLKDIYFLNLLE